MSDSDKEKVLVALKQNRIAVLATVTEDGRPQAVTVLYVTDDEFNFYFVTREKSRKVANLDSNGLVALSIGAEPPFNVQVEGRAVRVEDEKLRGEKLTELAGVGAEIKDIWPPILQIGDEDYVLYEILPTMIRALDLSVRNIVSEEPPYIDVI